VSVPGADVETWQIPRAGSRVRRVVDVGNAAYARLPRDPIAAIRPSAPATSVMAREKSRVRARPKMRTLRRQITPGPLDRLRRIRVGRTEQQREAREACEPPGSPSTIGLPLGNKLALLANNERCREKRQV